MYILLLLFCTYVFLGEWQDIIDACNFPGYTNARVVGQDAEMHCENYCCAVTAQLDLISILRVVLKIQHTGLDPPLTWVQSAGVTPFSTSHSTAQHNRTDCQDKVLFFFTILPRNIQV